MVIDVSLIESDRTQIYVFFSFVYPELTGSYYLRKGLEYGSKNGISEISVKEFKNEKTFESLNQTNTLP